MAVAEDQIPHLPPGRFEPTSAGANTLPCGDLGINEEPQFVAGVEEGRVLRIVRESNEVAAQIFENFGIPALEFRR